VIGVDVTARAVAEHYGARSAGGLLDGWLVDESDDDAVAPLADIGLGVRAVPLFMTNPDLSRELASEVLALAADVPRRG
jgi:LPPG:FO 2-phospho-L-lactate transferase